MLDFETLGTTPDAAVISLGAVLFNREKVLDEKLWIFNLEGQLRGKRAASADTISWWVSQGEKARSIFERAGREGILLREFVPQFIDFINLKDIRVWGNDLGFDVGIMEHILIQQGRTVMPWKFWNRRCYRTIKACFGIDKGGFAGVKHDALDDAKHQAKCLMEFWAKNPGTDK
jgi:exodeoxyribonuclease VIII